VKIALFIVVTIVAAFVLNPSDETSALGLKVAPLEYKTVLTENERKTGYIDISNPSSQAVKVRTSVQAFRQINDEGGLQFYTDKQVELGIITDLQSFEIGPLQAMRMFFTINGKNLPDGDVFAAVFFTTEPKQVRSGVGQLVRVGTMLSIVNKTSVSRKAEISDLTLPFFQFSGTVKGSYKVKNTGPKDTGFYPTVKISTSPGNKTQDLESTLVFGGRERTNDFTYQTGLGLHRIDVAYGNSNKSRWVLTIAPWMFILILLILFVAAVEVALLKKRRRKIIRQPNPSTP
jgi:hypothetical protein